MIRTVELSESDLVDMLKLQFHMVAETLAQIAAVRGEKTIVKLHTELASYEVRAVLMATAKIAQEG